MRERWGVSGSHGFIGSNLVHHLEQSGHEVIKLDRSGFVPPVDRIIDLAAYGNMYDQTDPTKIYEANIMRLIDILKHGEAYKVKSLIITSTMAIKNPIQTFYSASKDAAENLAQIFARDHNLPLAIVRPASIYGVGEQKEHLIPKLIDSCLNGTPMQFVGEPLHDFMYIDDFVNAVKDISVRGIVGVFNLGSGTNISNEEVLTTVEKVTGKKANITRVENMRSYDMSDSRPNFWIEEQYVKTSFEEGIRRMVNDCR